MSTPTVKKGESFGVDCVYSVDGAPANLAGVTVKSQVRERSGKLLAELTYTATGGIGQYSLAGATDGWPLGIVYWDVKYSSADLISYTDTMQILVLEAQTR